MIIVRELMERELFIISPERSVKSAGELMNKNNTSYLLVMDGEKLCGIVTSTDLCSHHPNRIIEDATVRDVICISDDDSIGNALVLMQDKGVKLLAVIDEKENVIGIIDENTILSYLASAKYLSEILSIAASVAHELNNSLGAISGYTETLQEYDVDESQRKYLTRIEKRVEQAATIIKQFKDFSGMTELKREVTDVNQLLKEALEMVEHQNIKIIQKYAPNLPQIQADASKLHQVFLNLTLNAKDAMPQGGELTISTDAISEDDIQITFADTGKGIPKENINKVFEPFFTTKNTGKGAGLGLFISRKIIEAHSGAIEVESQERQGTTFRIILPATTN